MSGWPRVTVKLGNEVVQSQDLREPVLTIGRLPDNSIVLMGIRVSDHHAQIRREPDRVTIMDLESTSGTFVDGSRIVPGQPYALHDGSEIQIGLYLLNFRAGEQEPDFDQSHQAHIGPERVATSPSDGARPLGPAPLIPTDFPSKYLQLLPVIFHDNDLFRRMLLIFENIWELSEQRQDFIEMYFDPRTCPSDFLRWLASWFDVTINPHWPESRVRALMLQLIQLYRWRGTKYGLSKMLEVCAGVTPEISTSTTAPFVIHISVQAQEGHPPDMHLIRELVEAHKPAHVGYQLEVRA